MNYLELGVDERELHQRIELFPAPVCLSTFFMSFGTRSGSGGMKRACAIGVPGSPIHTRARRYSPGALSRPRTLSSRVACRRRNKSRPKKSPWGSVRSASRSAFR